MAQDQLLQDGVVVRVGLIVHDPTARHELELLVGDERLDLLLSLERLLGPPEGEEGDLGPDELPARVDGQLLDQVVEDLPGLSGVVVVERLDPP